MKKLFSLWCILFISITMFAQHRSEQEAIQIAQEFLGKNGKTPQLSVVPHQKVETQIHNRVAAARRASVQEQAFYVINDEASNRFIIVSADEKMHNVLGYSDNNLFDAESVPTALLELMSDYERQYTQMAKTNTNKGKKEEEKSAPLKEIPPMITSKWGQSSPFNASCPIDKSYDNDTLSVTGCIATAMAQILNYWQHPTKCTGGTYAYYNPCYSGYQIIAFNYNDYEINWNNLVDDYNNASEDQKAEVSKLMYACGVSVAMGYSADGSGAMDYNIPYALRNFFGYNPNIVYRNRDYYTVKEWNAMIMEDLSAGRPVLYAGYNENHKGGHEWILDGCNAEGLYHCNFGQTMDLLGYLWSGIGDGYYRLDAVKPTFFGEEIADWSYYQSMIIGITPNTIGNHEDTFFSDVFALVPESYFSPTVSYNISTTCYSSDTNDDIWTDDKFSGEIGIGLFDADFKFIASMYSEQVSIKGGGKYERLDVEKYITLDTSAMENGIEYIIAPYAKSSDANMPTMMRTHMLPTWYSDEYKDNAFFYYKAKIFSGMLLLTPNSIRKEDIVSGDANSDGVVDVADIVYIVNYIMEKPADDFNFTNADVDGDGIIDVADITLVVNIIMQANGSQAPAYVNGVLTGLSLADLGSGKAALNVPTSSQYVASQFDVIVPSGSSITDISLNADIVNTHEVRYNQIGSNRYRVVVYSSNNNTFENNSGDLLTIKTNGNSDKISVENIVCVTSSGVKYGYTNTKSNTTGIRSITTANNNHAIYTIDGRKVKQQNLSKGMYIINGKKLVVK